MSADALGPVHKTTKASEILPITEGHLLGPHTSNWETDNARKEDTSAEIESDSLCGNRDPRCWKARAPLR
jgi:hypothetical protein